MKNLRRVTRKSYAMKRMASAIDRAIRASTSAEKERSARWAAAWGLLCGINTNSSRLRSSEVQPVPHTGDRRATDRGQAAPGEAAGQAAAEQIVIPSELPAEHIARLDEPSQGNAAPFDIAPNR